MSHSEGKGKFCRLLLRSLILIDCEIFFWGGELQSDPVLVFRVW